MNLLLAALLALSAPRAQAESDAPSRKEFFANLRKAETRQEPDERLEYYGRAIKAWTPDAGAALLAVCHFGRGQAYFDRGEFKQAEPDLTKALNGDPRNARAYFLRGRVHLKEGRGAKAALDLAEFVGLQPEEIDGLLFLCEAQRRTGRTEEAFKTYERAGRLEPADYRPVLGMGQTQMAVKDWRQAVRSLDRSDGLARGRAHEVFIERAVCRAALADLEGAVKDYGAGLALYSATLDLLARAPNQRVLLAETQDAAGRAHYGRGRVLETLFARARALADYTEGCRLGHAPSCRRAAEPRKKAVATPSDDTGERIYAN